MDGVTVPRVSSQKLPRIPSQSDMEALLDKPDATTVTGRRDKALLELMYSSGLRASEVTALLVGDFSGDSIRVFSGKGDRSRVIPLTEAATEAIRLSLADRGRTKGADRLFVTIKGKPLNRSLLFVTVRDYAKAAGLEDVSPHTLRHACATHLLECHADLRVIQTVLGHKSISTTEKYTHLSSTQIKSEFNLRHPRKKSV